MRTLAASEIVETLERIESLIRNGAVVRLGARRIHVIHKDADGFVKLTCDRAAWDAYKDSGRPMPKQVTEGLR